MAIDWQASWEAAVHEPCPTGEHDSCRFPLVELGDDMCAALVKAERERDALQGDSVKLASLKEELRNLVGEWLDQGPDKEECAHELEHIISEVSALRVERGKEESDG